ncbi:hypothetical protein IJT93_11715 [bacterium]|nr:hypothetical protein [bacterium]
MSLMPAFNRAGIFFYAAGRKAKLYAAAHLLKAGLNKAARDTDYIFRLSAQAAYLNCQNVGLNLKID